MNLLIRPIIIVIGTRPEGIKLVPVYFALKKQGYPVRICATFQHTSLLQEVFDLFGIKPDFKFDIMRVNQDLFHITQAVLGACKKLFSAQDPQLIIVQGDTSSAMAAALAAFYLKIPVAHVEAGLRTGDLHAPFPEELNRQFIGLIAKYHFAPSSIAAANLEKTGVNKQTIYQVGNTVVDALYLVINLIEFGVLKISTQVKDLVNGPHGFDPGFAQGFAGQANLTTSGPLVLLTMHRRESFGEQMLRALTSIKEFAQSHPEVTFIYPMHPNPQVQLAVNQANLQACPNIKLTSALAYHELVFILTQVDCVVTDSGGIQEEAASLGKPVVLLREQTDRPEAVQAGLAWLAGYDKVKIHACLNSLFLNLSAHGECHTQLKEESMVYPVQSGVTGLYGDGQSASKIVEILKQEIQMVKVAVVGLGYIGLPTAILLAESGFEVLGCDIDASKIEKIKQGVAVIEERELGARLLGVYQTSNFHVSTVLSPASYFIIAVPTPITSDHKADLSYVWQAVAQIALVLAPGACVIVESTVPVGTTGQIASYLAQKTGLLVGQDFFVAFSPERVIPGRIFMELVYNDRLVGGVDLSSTEIAVKLYASFVKGAISQTDASTAEMVKLVENSSRDVQIAFANQVASMAQVAGLDAQAVINFANKHPRVKILTPGCGVGGHCIAVDPWFLVESFPAQSKLLQVAREINDSKPLQVLAQISQKVAALQTKTGKNKIELVVLGVTYKPDVDDLRNSPAFYIAQELQKWPNLNLTVVEPYVDLQVLNQHFKFAVSKLDQLIIQPDLVVALVAHTSFKQKASNWTSMPDMLDFCAIREQLLY